jgi:hypothetical protein
MNTILRQRRFFLTKTFEITDKSLKVKVSTPISSVEEEIDFENISTKYTRKKLPKIVFLIFSFLLLIAVIITVFSHFIEKNGSTISDIMVYVVLFIIFTSLLFLTYENEISVLLYIGKSLKFYIDSPSVEETENFIEHLKKNQKAYLLRRYGEYSSYLTEEQMSNNLKWLWERKIIDDLELKDLREKILEKPPGQHVGFRFNTESN